MERREQILESASKVFARYGFRKTTTEDIARGCGLTKAALYHYFESKQDIFAEVVRYQSEHFLRRIREAIAAQTEPRGQLEAAVRARFKVFEELLLLHQVSGQTASELVPLAEEARQHFFREEGALIEGILERGRRDGVFRVQRPGLLAVSFISACKGLELHFAVLEDAPALEEGVTELLELLFNGLCR